MEGSNEFVVIGDGGDKFQFKMIELFGFPEDPSYIGGYDGNGYVEIQSGDYFAQGDFHFNTGELVDFYGQLLECYNSLTGCANFKTFEGNLKLSVEFDPQGRVRILGSFKADMTRKSELTFELFNDQSYLPGTIRAIKAIAETYGGQKRVKN